MSRPIDWQERERGRDPTRSWIVQAPAGSGKTELLTQRMLSLLARVKNPEEVIAITFTRKAAAEMSHRLLEQLQKATRPPEGELEPHQQVSRDLALGVLKNNNTRGWNLLEQPSRLRIRTIDSLCSDLARQLPLLSGLGDGQQITEDPDSLYRIAAARTMAALEDDNDELQADVIRVLDRYDNQYDRLVELLTSMLGRREQWISHLLSIRTEGGFNRGELEESLSLLIEAELHQTRQSLPENLLTEMPRCLQYALSNLPVERTEVPDLLEACGGPECSYLDLSGKAESLSHWVTLIDFLLTKSGNWRTRPDANLGFPAPSQAKGEEKARRQIEKDNFSALLDSLRDNTRLLEQLNTIRKLPGHRYQDEAWESLESLIRILIRAAAEWKVVMSESGGADFSEIAARAIDALGSEDDPSNLALRMDYRIEHLLVDEFQDTSMSQIRLLSKLTAGWTRDDGRTLFLVGDPMQSIYRFRKAEVSLFIKACKGLLFEHIDLKTLKLQVNFRSTQPIVSWVNQVFPQVMPERSDPVQGAVHYSESAARPGAPSDGTVTLTITPDTEGEKEARHVIEIIRNTDPEKSVAILVRSRKHAADILALLDQLKVNEPRFRYQAIGFNPLAEAPLIQDLVALTLALTQPADRLAWLTVLRAPYVGLDLADMDELAGGNAEGILLDSLANPDGVSESGKQRIQRISPVLLGAANRRGQESIRTRVESTWTRLGGPACAGSESELDDAATFFDLLSALERENLPIDRDTLDHRLEKLFAEPDTQASDKLQVLTIFTAKGLQFDTVILPGLNRSTGRDPGKLLHWFEMADEDRIVMSPMRNSEEKERQKQEGDLIMFISDIEKRRQHLENGRLLYVATTRAVRNLHLFAAVKPMKNGAIKAGNGTLLAELWPAIEAEQTPLIQNAADELVEETGDHIDGDEPGEASTPARLPQVYRRLSTDWELPEPPGAVQQNSADLADVKEFIEFRWAGEDARLAGNLVHRLLQLVAEQGMDAWTASGGMTGREDWCRRQLRREGVQGKKADSIVRLTVRAVDNCLNSDRGKWILSRHENATCELALTAVLDGQARNLILDRTFVENGTRWIIDYKTSSHSGGDLEGFLENEMERYREQLLRYRDAVAVNESRPIRTALYFPLLDRFCEVGT